MNLTSSGGNTNIQAQVTATCNAVTTVQDFTGAGGYVAQRGISYSGNFVYTVLAVPVGSSLTINLLFAEGTGAGVSVNATNIRIAGYRVA